MPLRIPTASQNAACDAIVDRADAGAGPGEIRIYSGAQPASANDAASGTLLATVVLADPAFGAAASGVATGTDPASVNATTTGTAGWFRLTDSAGATVLDGDVTATGGGGVMTLSTTSLTATYAVDITALTVTMPAA